MTQDFIVKLTYISYIGKALDVALAAEVIRSTKSQVSKMREFVDKYHGLWYKQALDLAREIDVEEKMPRRTNRQQHRSNTPSETAEEYFERVITIPLLGKNEFQ